MSGPPLAESFAEPATPPVLVSSNSLPSDGAVWLLRQINLRLDLFARNARKPQTLRFSLYHLDKVAGGSSPAPPLASTPSRQYRWPQRPGVSAVSRERR